MSLLDGGVMRLPLDVEPWPPDPGEHGLDHAQVDWNRVRRSAYVIHQRISYRYEGPVHSLRQRLVVQPRDQHGDQRRVSRDIRVLDATPRRVCVRPDLFGNTVVDIAIPFVAEEVTFISWSVVERDAGHGPHLASAALLSDPRLLTQTQLTTCDPRLAALADELADAGLAGRELAEAANQRVHAEMAYVPDVTGVRTTAAEAYAQHAGVCQDYAHVLIAVCRRLGLPARYVSGQLLGIGGSHAWVEVIVPDGCGRAEVLSLDPTHGRRTSLTYLTVAVGRDYADVAPLSGSYRAGPAGRLTTSKRVAVMRIDADGLTGVDGCAVA